MGDNQYCFIPYEFGYPGLNLGFVFHVEGGGGLVKQDDRGIFQQGAGDRDTLAFSTGQGFPVFPDNGLVALGHFADEFITLGKPCGT